MRYRIRDLREDHDKDQSEVAEFLQITQAQYSNLENQKSDINGEKIIRLCKLYNVSADYILGLIDHPKPLK